jgi:hypothetical protein
VSLAAGTGWAPVIIILLAGQAAAAAEYLVHARVFHRPGTAHARWWSSRPARFRRACAASGLAYWLAVTALLYASPPAALALTWAWVAGYGALLIARRGSARPGREEA